MRQHYRINSPAVVHEMIDDEVVIVHLESGRYYSLDDIGAGAWAHLEARQPLEAVIKWAANHFDADRRAIEEGIQALFEQLVAEQLIVPQQIAEPADDSALALPAIAPGTPFTSPQLQTYTDMEELLLLDPIHEVDDTGWPRQN